LKPGVHLVDQRLDFLGAVTHALDQHTGDLPLLGSSYIDIYLNGRLRAALQRAAAGAGQCLLGDVRELAGGTGGHGNLIMTWYVPLYS
jgi:hypothetical protein